MTGVLSSLGYLHKEKYGTVSLTESGERAANCIEKRRVLIREFLTDILGLDANAAELDACRMEHDISAEAAERLDKILSGKNGLTGFKSASDKKDM